MFLAVVTGILLIAVGIGMFLMPDLSRKFDRFENKFRGRQAYQGQAYEVGRVLRTVDFVGAGIPVLLMPLLF